MKRTLCLILALVCLASLAISGCSRDPDSASMASSKQAKNLVATKTASAGGAVTAHPGGRITYTISITNNNKKAVAVKVSDTLPENTTLVSGCDNAEGNSLSWKVKKIEPGQTEKVTYTVSPDYTVKQVRESKEPIILKNTPAKVMKTEVPAPEKDIYVLETFNATDIRRMEMAIDSLVTANLSAKNSGNKSFSELNLLTMMYYVGFTCGTNFGTTELDQILNMIYDNGTYNTGAGGTSVGAEDVVETAQNLVQRVAPTLFGGTKVPAEKDKLFRGERAKDVTIADLITGDVIVVENAGEYKLYIVDGKNLVHLGKTRVTRQISPDTVLPGLPQSDRYVVIRPSINMNVNLSLNEDEYFNDADKEGYTELEKALIATAEAYLLRGDRTQYTDDNAGKSLYRWESGVRQPEDYTVDQYGYTNCAAFTYDVHWTTYGYAPKSYNSKGNSITLNTTANLASSAARGWNEETLTGDNKSTIFHYTPEGVLSDEEKAEKTEQICSLLRPGDIICIRRTTGSGHAMLYVGGGLIIHSSGSSYSNANKTDTHEASIRFRAVMDLFDPNIVGKTSYVFNLKSFSIIRPQNNTTAKVTENAANRAENMQGIIAEKISSTAMGKTVNPGDTVTYTFYIFNTTKQEKQVVIKDELSQLATFVSATDGGKCADNVISWNLNIPADTRIPVSYTIKVKDDVNPNMKIDGGKATVNGVLHKCFDTVVGHTLTAGEQAKLVEAVNTLADKKLKLNAVGQANKIYQTAFNVDNIFGSDVKTLSDLVNGSGTNNVGIFNDSSNYSDSAIVVLTDMNTSNACKMVAPGLFGGHNVYTSSRSNDPFYRYMDMADNPLRSRYFWEKDLVVGDLLVMQGEQTECLYIYTGNNTFVSLTPDTMFETQSVTDLLGYAPSTDWLYTAVLRPSLVLEMPEQ